jgi:hypothetical protein
MAGPAFQCPSGMMKFFFTRTAVVLALQGWEVSTSGSEQIVAYALEAGLGQPSASGL